MADLDKVLKSVLKQITPTPSEQAETERVLEKVKAAVEAVLKPHKLTYTIAGSYIRDTYMRDKKEFDIFIMFPENASRKRLEETGLKVGKDIVRKLRGTYQIAFAEHPYTRAKVGKYAVDIVPCYKLKSASQIKSAVDRTPFHNRWLKKSFPSKLAPEVRLLKQFSKSSGIYGSDTRVLGLSGYLCELLISKYGSFKGFVKACSQWEPGEVFIDLENHHPTEDARNRLRKQFRDQPLIVIDPVDPNRNVAAALSPGKFIKLSDSCKRLLKSPSSAMFFRKPKKVTLTGLESRFRKRKTRFLGVLFDQPQVIQDVLWPQLRRFGKRLKDILEEYEFHVVGCDSWSDPEFTKSGQSLVLLEMEVWKLPNIRKAVGPSIFVKNRSKQFLDKYKPKGRIMVEGKCWVAEVDRQWKTASDKLRDSLSDKRKILLEKGIPSHIADSVSKKFRLLDEKSLLKLVKRKQEVGAFILDYLEQEVL